MSYSGGNLMLKYVPNILTIFRFVLIPFLILGMITNSYIATLVILTISAVTDVLDGFIARKFNFISDFGKLMDPLADKLTQITVLVGFTIKNIIPVWILSIVLVKELTMISGASFLYGKELVVSSRWYGKLTTVTLYFAMVSSLIINELYSNGVSGVPKFDIYIYYLALGLTIFSLIMYGKTFLKEGHLKDKMKIREN